MYYIFIINNLEFGEGFWTATEVMDFLLKKNLWAFSFNAPNLRHFDEGDRVAVYLAGKRNRVFAADFTIATKAYEVKMESDEPDWLAMFPMRTEIRCISQWEKHLPIRDVIDKLDFIKDKKNYGLYFRQSSKVITETDFSEIINYHI